MERRAGHRILWVDDEVDLLRSHVLFLEERGYEVLTATNGDDALNILQDQAINLVLLDEQMPGRTGMETFEEIRAERPTLPVVIVTKTEGEDLMEQAIGQRIDDYLVKPINPNQVFSVCKRLLEGEAIRQEALSQDFIRRFRELFVRREEPLGWQGWAELSHEVAQWEVRLIEEGERGLLTSLLDLKRDLRLDFCGYYMAEYPGWLAGELNDRPPLSPDLIARFLFPLLEEGRPVLFIIVDCLRLDQFQYLLPSFREAFDVSVDYAYSILPSATPYARNAIFSGYFPGDLARRFPDRWTTEEGEGGLNAHEEFFLRDLLTRHRMEPAAGVTYQKVLSVQAGEDLVTRLPNLFKKGLTAIVFGFIDLLTHGRSESEILMEMAPDEQAFRTLTGSWYRHSTLRETLERAAKEGVTVLLTTDHGAVHALRPATVFARRDATANLRYKFGANLQTEGPTAYLVKDAAAIRLPDRGINVNYAFAIEDYYFVYPTKLREYQSRYHGSFLHGGISPEEIILPVATMRPR